MNDSATDVSNQLSPVEMQRQIQASYDRISALWDTHHTEILGGKCGFSILGSKPVQNTPLMILGLNPGFNSKDEKGDPHVQRTWPDQSYFEHDQHRYKDRLADLLDFAGQRNILADAVVANFNFFKSNKLTGKHHLAWSQVPRELRRTLETACLEELQNILSVLKPKKIFVLGMKAADAHLPGAQEQLCDARGNWLIAKGDLWGRPAVVVKHPTGARWSSCDWDRAKQWFADNGFSGSQA
jgi:hypothetical protein